MCGIVGYVGRQQAAPILLDGLRRLEYRGYDSAGLSIVTPGRFQVRKRKGKIHDGLARQLAAEPVSGSVGIGHTRWATHGPPSDENSHPHLDRNPSGCRCPGGRVRSGSGAGRQGVAVQSGEIGLGDGTGIEPAGPLARGFGGEIGDGRGRNSQGGQRRGHARLIQELFQMAHQSGGSGRGIRAGVGHPVEPASTAGCNVT